jgi:hypothetical protein
VSGFVTQIRRPCRAASGCVPLWQEQVPVARDREVLPLLRPRPAVGPLSPNNCAEAPLSRCMYSRIAS